MKKVFWNLTEHRLRAGWRILIQIILVSVPLSILATLGFFTSGKSTDTSVMAAALPITVFSILVLARYIDRRKFSDYGLRLNQKRWWEEYAIGFIAGFLIACLFVFFLKIFNAADVRISPTFIENKILLLLPLVISMVTYAGIGFFEELIRTYQVRNIAEGLARSRIGLIGAMVIAVLLAGLNSVIMHALGQDPIFLLFIFISGALYGVYYLFTKRTAIAMAYHFSWDLTISFIFLLGATNTQEPALFLVRLLEVPGINTSSLLALVGIFVRLIGFGCIAAWLNFREGGLIFHRDIVVPSLIPRKGEGS
jgi:membrane protease YdiL (CAAX protease family)